MALLSESKRINSKGINYQVYQLDAISQKKKNNLNIMKKQTSKRINSKGINYH